MRYRHVFAALLLMAAGFTEGLIQNTVVAQAAKPGDEKSKKPIPKEKPRDDQPIPQDIAKAEKRNRDRLEWLRRTIVGAYDKVGKKDPRWDEAVRKTLELAAQQLGKTDAKIAPEQINQAAKVAIDLGCDDPLLVNIFYRTSGTTKDMTLEELTRRRDEASKNLVASRYPAFRRASTLLAEASQAIAVKNPGDPAKKRAKADFDAALTLLGESVATDERNEFWEDKWFDNLRDLIKGYRNLGDAPEAAYTKVDSALNKLPEIKALRLQVRGAFWFDYGWEARTKAFAPQVPAKAAEAFLKRVTEARKAYEEAWKVRPGDGRTARCAPHHREIDRGRPGQHGTLVQEGNGGRCE